MSDILVSIDINDAFIAIAAGKLKGGSLLVKDLRLIPVPEGTIADDKLQNPDKVKELRKHLKDAYFKRKLSPKKKLAVSIGNSNTISRQLVMPAVKGGNMKPVINYEMDGYLPGGSVDYVIQHKILEILNDEDGFKRLRLFVSAANKKTVESFYNFAVGIGTKPIALDMQCESARKLYSLCKQINGVDLNSLKTVALIDLGFSSVSVSIVRDNALEQVAVIRAGSRQLRDAVAAAFDFQPAEAQAEIDKFGNLSAVSAEPASDDQRHIDALNDIIKDSLSYSAEEMRRIFSYYSSRNIGYDIGHVFIYGYMSRLKGIPEYLSESLGVTATRMKALDKVKLDPKLDKAKMLSKAALPGTDVIDSCMFINALGSLIQKAEGKKDFDMK